MTHITSQDTMAANPADATLAAGWPRAARSPDGAFDSALPGAGAPSGEAL